VGTVGDGVTHTLHTIGYEAANVDDFLGTLTEAGVTLLVDVRRVASSRRPGFAKTRLGENLATVGIRYLHLRELGTPAEGRAAARAGRTEEMKRIVRGQLETEAAQQELQALAELVAGGSATCLLCLEAEPAECHRSVVAEELARRVPLTVQHLFPQDRRGREASPD
jgi:uncharacterized protein (DUF488 family)